MRRFAETRCEGAALGLTRRDFVRVAGAGAVVLATGGILSSCAGNAAEQGGSAGSEASGADASSDGVSSQVIIAMPPTSEPAAGFDPLVAWGCGEHVHEPLIQSTLITTNENLEFVNDLATDYACADDGLSWTFQLRDDVVFSDGQPLTARDVAFTINGIIESGASEADLSMVDEAVASDDVTVQLSLNKPFNALLYTLAVVGIVPEHAYGQDYGRAPIGSGRYLLEQWDQGQQVILCANPAYYGEAPTMERVVVVFMEEDAALAAVQAGQVDIAYTSATLAGNQPEGYELLACESVDSRGISLPCVPTGSPDKVEDGDMVYEVGNDFTCDVAVRRAINYAIDRQALVDKVLNGYGKPAFSVSDGMPWASPDMQVATDVEQARRLLADAGWVAGDDGILQRKGVRASFPLHYAAGDSVRQAMAFEVANQLAQIGIEVLPQGGSWDDIYPRQYQDPVVWGWGSNSPTEIYYLNRSDGWGNFSCYESATIDKHLDDALAQPTLEDSYTHWQLAQWDGTDGIAPKGAATWAWLANVDHLYFRRAGLNVAAQKPHPHGHGWSLVNNVDRWSW